MTHEGDEFAFRTTPLIVEETLPCSFFDIMKTSSNVENKASVASGGIGAPANGAGRPEWIRLPKVGTRCPHTGLSRSAMNELVLGESPRVESFVLKKPGTTRGTRLVRFNSLLEFLDRVALMQKESGSLND